MLALPGSLSERKMAAKILAAVCALCCGQLARGVSGSVALFQSGVYVHRAPTDGSYLVDNSFLQHKGPGVLMRRSKNLTDMAGRDKFVKWGTLLEGEDAGEWVKFEGFYLPKEMHSVRVLTLQPVSQRQPGMMNFAAKTASHFKANMTVIGRRAPMAHPHKLRFSFVPTEFLTSSGAWVAADILRPGTQQDTYDVLVKPTSFASYNITNVPSSSLKKVQRVREFVPVPTARPNMKALRNMDAGETGFVKVTVKDSKANNVMELKMMKKSPMRTIMKMACERARIHWFKCEKKVNFVWNGKPLSQNATTKELGITDGATIIMAK